MSGKDAIEPVSGKEMKTKLVVRRIPVDVSEEAILESLSPFGDLFDKYWFCEPPRALNPSRRRRIRFNRFYLHFSTPEQARQFALQYRELPLENGRSIKPIVEFAPSQKMPQANRKMDRRMDTISSDNDYIRFIDSLEDGTLRHEPEIETPEARVLAGMEAACNARNLSRKLLQRMRDTLETKAAPVEKMPNINANSNKTSTDDSKESKNVLFAPVAAFVVSQERRGNRSKALTRKQLKDKARRKRLAGGKGRKGKKKNAKPPAERGGMAWRAVDGTPPPPSRRNRSRGQGRRWRAAGPPSQGGGGAPRSRGRGRSRGHRVRDRGRGRGAAAGPDRRPPPAEPRPPPPAKRGRKTHQWLPKTDE